ncbi:MAG TPA: protoporphyrinogen oxidase [Roseiflexaceae bacterium]|nr:protoporphyrinogen oxidase [Roseiflexaceae bacterium]
MTRPHLSQRPAPAVANLAEAPHIVIIGGGITGLSAAYTLQQAAQAVGAPMRYTLIERAARLGGKILTECISAGSGTFVVEGGPDSFVAQKPWAIELVRELGLGHELMASNQMPRTTYVLHRGRPLPLPEGTMLIVPTKLVPFARSPLFSPLGKLRMALDLLIPPRRDAADETLAAFIRRRLGREALDRLAEPLMAGIHSAECERQSVLATFPRFRELEAQHGGLIRGMLAARRRTTDHRPTINDRRPTAVGEGGDGSSVVGRHSSFAHAPFVTLRGGVQALVDALVLRLEGAILTGRGVTALAYDPAASRPYRLCLDDGTLLEANAVVLTAPAYAAADLLAPLAPALAAALRTIRYVSTGTITLAYRRADVGSLLDGYGVVIPRAEGRQVNAVTLSSLKFRHRAPEDHLLVRVFVGGSRTPEALALDDTALLALAREELRAILGIDAEPLFARVYRWQDANPQYDVGHLERVAALDALCPEGLYLAGSAYRGVGIPDCVRQGREAGERALALVTSREHTWG